MHKSVKVMFIVLVAVVILTGVIGVVIVTNKHDIKKEDTLEYLSDLRIEESITEEPMKVDNLEDITFSDISFPTEEEFEKHTEEIDVNEIGYNVVMENKNEVLNWLDLIGAGSIDFELPYSLSGNIVIFETTIGGEDIQVQIITDGEVIVSMSILQEVDEQAAWLPVGDTDRSDDLVIVDVGAKKFDITYGEHAALFEVIANMFSLTDALGGTTYVEMVDCDKENTIKVLVTNNQQIFYVQDVGEYYKAWQDDELTAKFLDKISPYREISLY